MSNRKNPVRFAVDFAGKQIIGTQASLNKAKRYGSVEYNELCKLVEAHPGFEVIKKEIAGNTKKETYKHLSFNFMVDYISKQPNADEIMLEYEEIKRNAKNWKMAVYPHTKSWFLKKFGGVDMLFDLDKAKEESSDDRLAAAQTEVVA